MRRIIDLGIIAPIHFLRDRRAFLLLFHILPGLKFPLRIVVLSRLPIQVVQLKMRRRQIGIQLLRPNKLRDPLLRMIRLYQ